MNREKTGEKTMKYYSRIAVLAVVAIFISGTFAFGADVAKIGVIDFEKILMESAVGKATQKKLKNRGIELQAKLEKEKEEIDALSKAFEREALVLSDAKKKEKEREFRIRITELKKMQAEFSKELKGMEIQLINDIQKDVFDIVSQIGKSQGYLLVVEKKNAGVVYMPDHVDITDLVIKKYNAKK